MLRALIAAAALAWASLVLATEPDSGTQSSQYNSFCSFVQGRDKDQLPSLALTCKPNSHDHNLAAFVRFVMLADFTVLNPEEINQRAAKAEGLWRELLSLNKVLDKKGKNSAPKILALAVSEVKEAVVTSEKLRQELTKGTTIWDPAIRQAIRNMVLDRPSGEVKLLNTSLSQIKTHFASVVDVQRKFLERMWAANKAVSELSVGDRYLPAMKAAKGAPMHFRENLDKIIQNPKASWVLGVMAGADDASKREKIGDLLAAYFREVLHDKSPLLTASDVWFARLTETAQDLHQTTSLLSVGAKNVLEYVSGLHQLLNTEVYQPHRGPDEGLVAAEVNKKRLVRLASEILNSPDGKGTIAMGDGTESFEAHRTLTAAAIALTTIASESLHDMREAMEKVAGPPRRCGFDTDL